MKIRILVALFGLADAPPAQTAAAWQRDLDHLVDRIKTLHADYRRCIDPAELELAAARLRPRIPELSAARMELELARIVALLGDGHSRIRMLTDEDRHLELLPFTARSFDDGYRITAASEPYQHLAGSRVLAIGGHPIEDLFARLGPYFAADSPYQRQRLLDSRVRFLEFLRALELIDDEGPVRLRVTGPDGQRDVDIVPRSLESVNAVAKKARRRSAARVRITHGVRNYGYDLLPRGRTLFVRVVACRDDPNQKVLAFVRELREFVDRTDFDRFVLDLRDNGGGSANYTVPFVRLIESHPKINREGRLFTLVSGRTYSAAMLCCGMLENRTKTLFVGNRTGQGVNLFGDAVFGTLPESGVRYCFSERWWQCSVPQDRRRWLEPDIVVPDRYAAYRDGPDSEFEAVLAYQHQPKTTHPATEAEAARYAGRYRFSAWQELIVTAAGAELAFRIRDLVDGPAWLAEVVSSAYGAADRFLTDITGVSFRRNAGAAAAPRIVFDWRGFEIVCERLPTGYRFPLEVADGGNIGQRPLGPDLIHGPDDPPTEIDPSAVPAAMAAVLADRDQYWDRMMLRTRFNTAGYRFLRTGRPPVALHFFRANVELFPRWWNSYDSLGEGLAAAGERDRAIAAYEKSIALNPGNDHGKRELARLRRRDR